MMNLGFLNAQLAKTASNETIASTPTTKSAVGLPSRNVSTHLGHLEAANGHTSQDLGLTTTQQHDYQQIEMDVNWAQMQKSRLPVKIVNKQPLLVVKRETVKPLAEPPRPHRRQRPADQAAVPILNNVNAELTKIQVPDQKVKQIGQTST